MRDLFAPRPVFGQMNWMAVAIVGVTLLVTARDASATSPDQGFMLSSNSSYSWQSPSGTTSTTHISTGYYETDFPSLSSTNGGNAQVTSASTSGNRCNVDTWSVSGSTEKVFTRCYTAGGSLADTVFTVSFFQGSFFAGVGAYLWNDQVSASGYPNSTYSWNSTGGTNYMVHNGTGSYTAQLPGLTSTGGIPLVTAFDDGSSTSGKYCNIYSWGPSSTEMNVNLRCFDHSGTAADSYFTLAYGTVAPIAGLSGAYAWTDQQTNTSWYTPNTTYQRVYTDLCGSASDTGHNISAKKTATGKYSISIPDLDANISDYA